MTGDTVFFPDGLPGFEQVRRYVVVSAPAFEPFCSLQGEGPGAPVFIAIDPRQVAPDYPCALEAADRARLHIGEDASPASSPLLWLALVTATDAGATVNLRAPIVINPHAMRGVQLVPAASDLPVALPLAGGGE